ncbi:MAG TPA: LysE family transporter [Gaiellales bacterium]|jgi:putative LysE/RhtB family amino acid efflux pump|nr:LysE family transporter [Gaiellales bacterium]
MRLLVTGAGLGFVLAAQVGPVTLLIVRSVLRGGRAVAVGVAMAVAVALIDLLYAAVGLAGAGRLLDAGPVRIALGAASAAILVAIGSRTLWRGLRARTGAEASDEVAAPGRAFATAIAATALNPLTIALWTVSFPATAPGAATASTGAALELLAGVAAGTLLWYVGFAVAVAATRRRIGARLLAAIDVAIGAALVLLGALLGERTLTEGRA